LDELKAEFLLRKILDHIKKCVYHIGRIQRDRLLKVMKKYKPPETRNQE
jgi:hypothetical protein